MPKKYIVRLSDAERAVLDGFIKKLKGTSQKVRRAQVLLKADADGPAWTDARIAEAFACRTQTVENLRERLVTNGFDETLEGKARTTPPRPLRGPPPRPPSSARVRRAANGLVSRYWWSRRPRGEPPSISAVQ